MSDVKTTIHIDLAGLSGESDDGGYVPADDTDISKLVDQINARLSTLVYYDGETAFGGPYRIWSRAEVWYAGVILVRVQNPTETDPVLTAMVEFEHNPNPVPDDPPRFPSPKHPWYYPDVFFGADAPVAECNVWLVPGTGVAVQPSSTRKVDEQEVK